MFPSKGWLDRSIQIVDRVSIGLFAALLLFVVFRDRSFWLDECFIIDILKHSTFQEILSGEALAHSQKFPRLYLAFLDGLGKISNYSTFWLRLPSLVLGVLGLYAWRHVFKRTLAPLQLNGLLVFLATSLLLWNGLIIYYCYELKPYSADLFFSGAIFLAYLKWVLPLGDFRQMATLMAAGCLFSYAAIFVSFALLFTLGIDATLNSSQRQRRWKSFGLLTSVFLLTLFLVWRIDVRKGERPAGGGTLHLYWADLMSKGETVGERASSTQVLLKRSVTQWWRPDIGVINERMLPESQRLPNVEGLWGKPDVRNAALLLVLYVLFLTFRNRQNDTQFIQAAFVLFLVASALAYFRLYPLGPMRLCLHLLPFSILILVGAIGICISRYEKYLFARVGAYFFSSCFLWLVLSQMTLVLKVVGSATIPENAYQAIRVGEIQPADQVFYPSSSKLMIDSIPSSKRLPTFHLLDDISQMPAPVPGVGRYYLWINGADAVLRSQLFTFENKGQLQLLYGPPEDARMALYGFNM